MVDFGPDSAGDVDYLTWLNFSYSYLWSAHSRSILTCNFIERLLKLRLLTEVTNVRVKPWAILNQARNAARIPIAPCFFDCRRRLLGLNTLVWFGFSGSFRFMCFNYALPVVRGALTFARLERGNRLLSAGFGLAGEGREIIIAWYKLGSGHHEDTR